MSTFVLKYSRAFRVIILNMWPSFNCSTRYSTGSKQSVLNSLAPTWNIGGVFKKLNNIGLTTLHSVLHLFHNPNMCNRNCIESKMKLVFILFLY